MENAYAQSTEDVLQAFSVGESSGLTDAQVVTSREKHGRNGESTMFPCFRGRNLKLVLIGVTIAIAEEPPTPIWELILEQFKDQLVIILLGSAAISFVLALFEEDGGWEAFVDPAVVCGHPL